MNSVVEKFTIPFLIMANVFFATEFPAVKLTVGAVGVAMLPFWQLLLGALVLLPILYVEQKSTKKTSLTILRDLTSRANIVLFILCIATTLSTNVFLMWGIKLAQASDAALLSLMIPIVGVTLGVVFLRERLTVSRIAALFTAMVGAIAISSPRLHGSGTRGIKEMHGDILILLSCFSSAVYLVVSKPLLKKFTACDLLIPSWLSAVAIFAVGITAWRPELWTRIESYQLKTWLGVLVVGFVSKGLGMQCYLSVLRYLEVGQVVVSTYLLPLFGLIFSVLSAHETISFGMVLGSFLIVTGNLVLTSSVRVGRNNGASQS